MVRLAVVGVPEGAPVGQLTGLLVGGADHSVDPNVGLEIFCICVGLRVVGVARACRWDYWW